MIGGNVSWTRSTGEGEHVYVTLARGYKGGGFNIGSGILSEQREFGPEALWSLETGMKYARAGSPLELQTDVFYMRRQNMQAYLSEQLQQNNPLNYVFSRSCNWAIRARWASRSTTNWVGPNSGRFLGSTDHIGGAPGLVAAGAMGLCTSARASSPSRNASRTFRAMGAAASAPNPPFSTSTEIAIFGSSAGA